MAQTIPGILDWWARMRPDQPVVILSGDTLTYAAYQAWSCGIAAQLIADGLEPGDRVAICATNSLTYCALMVGVIRAGGIVSPVNFRYTAREIAELCETTTPRLCFAGPDQMAAMAAAGYPARPIASLNGLREPQAVPVAHDAAPDAPVVIIATSGSTAKPKGVVYSNRSMTAYAANWALEETSSSAGSRIRRSRRSTHRRVLSS